MCSRNARIPPGRSAAAAAASVIAGSGTEQSSSVQRTTSKDSLAIPDAAREAGDSAEAWMKRAVGLGGKEEDAEEEEEVGEVEVSPSLPLLLPLLTPPDGSRTSKPAFLAACSAKSNIKAFLSTPMSERIATGD